MHTVQWAENLPFMEVRKFIVEELSSFDVSMNIGDALSPKICHFLGTPVRSWCASDLAIALTLIPEGWWWHISHLEVQVIPTKPVYGAPVSNGTLYDYYGRPVAYTSPNLGIGNLPIAVCIALLKARYDLPAALIVEASQTEYIAQQALTESRFRNVELVVNEE